jgi:predicted phage gp36 major capsid-like protein
MSYINELREQRGKAIHDARALLEKAKTEKRELSEEEEKSYSKFIDDSDALRTKIEREEKQVELDREAAALAADDEKREEKEKKTGKVDETRAFERALAVGLNNLNGDELRALSMDNNVEGGYLIPPVQWVSDLIQAVDNQVFIRGLATTHTVNAGHSLGVPSLETDIEDATWSSEIATVNEDTALDFGNRELSPHNLNKMIKVSMQLLEHAPSAQSIVQQRMAYKFGVTQEKAFLTGSGASQPLGVMTASADGISTGRDVSTGTQWVFHRDAVKMISQMKDGDGQYLWQPGITVGDPDRLLGFPINVSEYQNNTFTTALYVGILGDFSHYWIADDMGLTVQRLNELYAANSQIGFIGRSRTDGMPVLEEAFVRVKLA